MLNRLLLPLTLLGTVASDQSPPAARRSDVALVVQLGSVRGTVTVVDSKLGRIPVGGATIYFQKDPENTVFGVHTDGSGTYRVSLSAGRYRIFSPYVYNHTEWGEFLAPSQERVIEIKRDESKVFNIEGIEK